MDKDQTEAQPPSRTGRARHVKLYFTEQHKKELWVAFNLFDPKSTGVIDIHDLKIALRALGYEPKREELKRFISLFDKDNKGQIGFKDLMKIMEMKINDQDQRELYKGFQLFDKENAGLISIESLKKVAEELDVMITDEELQEMMTEADHDCDGIVSQDDFFMMLMT